ncbi:MAG TPA: hypothetical protein VIR63_06440 [Pontiella sp.]
MFLPSLLMRDMGWAGFLIFAIPNVLGAAAMGWTIKSRAASVSFVERHPAAVWWFSAVTLAFHTFWISWFSSFALDVFSMPRNYLFPVLGISLLFLAVLIPVIRKNQAPLAAFILLAFSLGVLMATFIFPENVEATTELVQRVPISKASVWMVPVMVFGFLLCPYLDVTFHHARQELDTKANGRAGFTIGFVGMFVFMIILTTRYAGVIIGVLEGRTFTSIAAPLLSAAMLLHILCQWIFTVGVHLDRIRTIGGSGKWKPALVGLVFVSWGTGLLASRLPEYAGLTGGEVVYRIFMSAYGLLFPTYVLYRVISAFKGKSPVSLTVMWIAVILATPLFWVGFIERQAFLLIPGMMILLLGAVKPWRFKSA